MLKEKKLEISRGKIDEILKVIEKDGYKEVSLGNNFILKKTYNSIEIIESMIPLCKKRFKRFEFRHIENKGVSATLNEGIMWSKGKYLSPLASDDMAIPNKTSYLVDKLEKSGHKAAFGSVTDMMNGKLIFGEKSQKTIYKFYDLFLLKKFIHGTACLININSLKDIGLYNENIAVEDLYMWLKLTEDGSNLICYPKVLAKYRTHANNTVDHSAATQEPEFKTLLGQFRIPVIFYHPSLKQGVKINQNLQQADILPTAMGLIKYPKPFISFGQNAFSKEENSYILSISGEYMLLQGDYLCKYLEGIGSRLYNIKEDINAKKEIGEKQPELLKKMTRKIEAIIQQYNNRLIENKLFIDNEKK
jgi:glycosyltransferase involved in cell wall biosynthesis